MCEIQGHPPDPESQNRNMATSHTDAEKMCGTSPLLLPCEIMSAPWLSKGSANIAGQRSDSSASILESDWIWAEGL